MARRSLNFELDLMATNNNKGGQNNNAEDKNNNMQDYELPADNCCKEFECICTRRHKTYVCGRCHQYFHGRLAERCQVHPTDVFLMDFRECPYCLGPNSEIKESKLSMEQVRQMEDAELPSDGDDF